MHRSTWLRSTLTLTFVSLFATAACSGKDEDEGKDPAIDGTLTPAQVCADVAADTCDRIYACNFNENELRQAGLPANWIACNGAAQEQLRCSAATAANVCAGQASSLQQAVACSSQVKGASCDAIKNSQGNVGSFASDCGPCGARL